jgi:hypothetical protein
VIDNLLEKRRQQHPHHARQHRHPLRAGVRGKALDDPMRRLKRISSSALSVTGPAEAWIRYASSMSRTLALTRRWISSASVLTRLWRWLRCDAVTNEESALVHQE